MYPCPICNTPIRNDNENRDEVVECPGCEERFIVELFPALTAPAADTSTARSVLEGGESSCFYHADKVAVQSCGYCGRFLCGLCEVPIDGRHLCPMCLAKGKDVVSTSSSLKSHALHDSIALSVAGLAFLAWPFAVLLGPAAFFLIFKNYRKNLGVIPRTRLRFWFAGIVALAGMGLAAFMLTSVFMAD